MKVCILPSHASEAQAVHLPAPYKLVVMLSHGSVALASRLQAPCRAWVLFTIPFHTSVAQATHHLWSTMHDKCLPAVLIYAWLQHTSARHPYRQCMDSRFLFSYWRKWNSGTSAMSLSWRLEWLSLGTWEDCRLTLLIKVDSQCLGSEQQSQTCTNRSATSEPWAFDALFS